MKRLGTFLVLLASACAYGQTGPISITSTECAPIGVGVRVSVITFQVTGTWTGTLQPKITVQGQAAANVQVTPSTSSTAQSTVTANGIYTAQVNGADTFQVCGNTVASGTANVYLNTSVASKGGGGSSGGGSGTVTSVTFTGDGVVDSSTPSTAVTASGTVAATIKTQTAHTFLGNSTGSTAAPTFASLALADLPGTVVNATSPGAGICHFAGSTQTCTSSAIVAADITSGTITGTQIASSVALAGSPTTTTQSANDNSTKVATTAYVDGKVATSTLRRSAFVMQDGSNSASGQIGEPSPGAFSGTFSGAITATSTCGPGRSTASAASSSSVAGTGNNSIANWQYGKSPVLQSEIAISTISTIRAWLAFSDQTLATQAASATPAGNWAGFRFDTGAGDTHWQACTSAAGSSGCTDTGITPDTACHLFEVNVTTGTNVVFKIDNTSVATVATHLPANSVMMGWNASVTTLAASAATLQYSFFYFSAGL